MEKNENKALKKEDFLNTRQLAAKLGENIDIVRDTMKAIFNRGTKIVIKNQTQPQHQNQNPNQNPNHNRVFAINIKTMLN